jgi:hypothetical protein
VPLSREVRGSGDKPLLHIWSEEYNLTSRVVAITDHWKARLVLAVERFGCARGDWNVCAPISSGPGIIDVLTITRSGRLVILELEASEPIHLPMQAADYGLRVRRHLELGEFRAYGYFPGVEIQQAPLLVYLVAPALRFHPATGALLRHLAPEIEFVRVGLTESWTARDSRGGAGIS